MPWSWQRLNWHGSMHTALYSLFWKVKLRKCDKSTSSHSGKTCDVFLLSSAASKAWSVHKHYWNRSLTSLSLQLFWAGWRHMNLSHQHRWPIAVHFPLRVSSRSNSLILSCFILRHLVSLNDIDVEIIDIARELKKRLPWLAKPPRAGNTKGLSGLISASYHAAREFLYSLSLGFDFGCLNCRPTK